MSFNFVYQTTFFSLFLFSVLFFSCISFASSRSLSSQRQNFPITTTFSPTTSSSPSNSTNNDDDNDDDDDDDRTPAPTLGGNSTQSGSKIDWSTLVIKLKNGRQFTNMTKFQIRRKFLQNGVFSFKGSRRALKRMKKLLEENDDVETVRYDKLHYLRKIPLPPSSFNDRETDQPTPAPTQSTVVKKKRTDVLSLSDWLSNLGVNPMFGDQWHLRNTGQSGGTQGEDVKAVDSFLSGFTGKGVTVAILDDGLEWDHPDFEGRVNLNISFDYLDDVADPSPKSSDDKHGTSVAGLIAGADNNVCGVGVAIDAHLVGFRAVGTTPITNTELSDAFLTHSDVIDIYSNSWGNSGLYLDIDDNVQPISDVLRKTATIGRKGKGGIILFAAGNDKSTFRTTNEDTYTTSPYTIVVAASHNGGQAASYSTPGSSVFLAAPSGDDGRSKLYTTDRTGSAGYDASGNCFSGFSGTSGATPVAAGVVALLLEANTNLNYRDVLHILSISSDVIDKSNPEWQINGGGRYVSHLVGFGRINALAATRLALNWVNIPEKKEVTIMGTQTNVNLPPSSSVDTVTLTLDMPIDLFLEHVQVSVDISHQSRGDLSITLVSPSGTQSYLKISKRADVVPNLDWTFMSTQHWGESSIGTWKLLIRDTFAYLYSGQLVKWHMTFHGMDRAVVPQSVIRTSPQASSRGLSTTSNCRLALTTPTCNDSSVSKCVCQRDTYCCLIKWDSTCVKEASNFGCLPSTPSPTPAPTSQPTPAPTPAPTPTPSPSSGLQEQTTSSTTCALTIFRASNLTCTVSGPEQTSIGKVATVYGSNMCTLSLSDSQGPIILNYGYVDQNHMKWNIVVFIEMSKKTVSSLTSSAFRAINQQQSPTSGVVTDWKLSNGVLSKSSTFFACY